MKSCIFSISSLGLGHATRTAPIIREYLKTHRVTVVSYGNALEFLRNEFSGKGVEFRECEDYPPIERGTGVLFYAYLAIDSLNTVLTIRKEHAFIRDLVSSMEPEFIISDGRYGSYAPGVPSFLISHQIRFEMPRGLGFFQAIADHFNYSTFKKFDAILIPDYEDEKARLAGKLSAHPMLQKLDHAYVGILSSIAARDTKKDIDALFTISGYLGEHKPSFVATLLEQAKKLPGKKVFVLGNAAGGSHAETRGEGIEVYPSVSGDLRQDLFNRAKAIVSRCGYTTVMDLAELSVPSLLVPTPGQTEQEYLAKYLKEKGGYGISADREIDLSLLKSAPAPVPPPWKTSESVRKVREIVSFKTRGR